MQPAAPNITPCAPTISTKVAIRTQWNDLHAINMWNEPTVPIVPSGAAARIAGEGRRFARQDHGGKEPITAAGDAGPVTFP
jgi:hypothetical protein